MKYCDIVEGRFIKRLNRFVAIVTIDGKEETVHVKNTGRCGELLLEGAEIHLQYVDKLTRKTKYSLINVYKEGNLFNIDSQVPNKVVEEGIRNNKIEALKDIDYLKREQTYGKSRFDFYYEKDGKKGFIEVKGVTLENNGHAQFPDAPTSRGTKHVLEMIDAQKEGYQGVIFFLLQFQGAKIFSPNVKMDPAFSDALSKAKKAGVKILVYESYVTKDSISIGAPIPFNVDCEKTEEV